MTAFYDPMVAKLIVHGETRDAALAKLQQALDATQLHGIATNLDYLRQIVATDAFRSGFGVFTEGQHAIIFPGVAIALSVLAVNFIGDGLRDALDPRRRR